MKYFVLAVALLGVAASAAPAQDAAVPDLRGTWTGKGKAVVLGNHAHHPGKQTTADPPRVRDIDRDPYRAKARTAASPGAARRPSVADNKEPFVWALSNDNRSIIGADVDGYFRITLITPDRMEKCYVHNAHQPEPLDRRDLLPDGPCEEVASRS